MIKKLFDRITLNPEQQDAATHTKGPLLVIAGAGSGKTRVITARIAHLILDHEVPADAIVALTFTNKAANEMKERIAGIIGEDAELPFLGTFHSYCVRLLKANSELVQAPFISILDEDDKKRILSGILQRNNLHKQMTANQAGYQISQMKNRHVTIEQPLHKLFDQPLMPDIYQAYEQEKRESKCLDFDDLLLETVQLFQKNKIFKKEFQNKVRHILVDEYQDTNVVQHELLKQMGLMNNKIVLDSICAVGDEDQSIYSWRGATVANMLTFQKDFPGTKIIKVEQNYRSVQPILETANHIIQHNKHRNPKKLWSEKQAKNRIKLLSCVSGYQEADAIVHLVNIMREHGQHDEIAVLYRTHAQSRTIEEALIKHSIPYKMIGGTQFYERKEIKDLLAYLKLIVNPFDRASFFRIINTPSRGLGDKFEELFYEAWKQEPFLTFQQIGEKLIDNGDITGNKKKEVQKFLDTFKNIQPSDKPSNAIESIIHHIAYLTHIKDSYDRDDAETRTQNIKELIEAMRHFESQDANTITLFLDEVALLQEKLQKSDDQEHKIWLMTLHAAKGLEFDIVILAGLEEGILPTSRSLYDENLEEERRLFYVGITRAKERLLLSHAKFRYTYGQMVDQLPSQFLDELPSKHIQNEDCSYWKSAQFRQYFADWLNLKHETTISAPTTYKRNKKIFQDIIAKRLGKDFVKAAPKPVVKSKSTAVEKSTSTTDKLISEFKVNHPVTHEQYGTGLVQKVENKNCSTIVTVKFKTGVKKIMSKFLQTA